MNFIKESLEVEVSDRTIKGQSGDTAIYLWHFWSLGGSTVKVWFCPTTDHAFSNNQKEENDNK